MRLINTRTLGLEEFLDYQLPQYAILSHTWEHDEVTYEDMHKGQRPIPKKGYKKIRYAARQARSDGLSYVWVDTCCIDKKSSAELQEAINSMYRYYAGSNECYVYLADIFGKCPLLEDRVDHGSEEVAEADEELDGWRDFFMKSRWFTRGWTLQELLAPKDVQFYGCEWNFVGRKKALIETLSVATRIAPAILTQRSSMSSISVAQRMSWAAHRETSRVEDKAYCLLGIFNVSLPMLYGEGAKAFLRLQEEILKTSTDHSIFAWDLDRGATADGSLLASSPSNFANCHNIVPWGKPGTFEMTNRGLRISVPTLNYTTDYQECHAILNCRYAHDFSGTLALRLQKYGGGDDYHAIKGVVPEQRRASKHAKFPQSSRLAFVLAEDMGEIRPVTLQITREFEPEASKIKFWIPTSNQEIAPYRIVDAHPKESWDINDGIMHAGDIANVRGGVIIRSSSGRDYSVAFGYDTLPASHKHVPVGDADKRQGLLLPGIWGSPSSRRPKLLDFVNRSFAKCNHGSESCLQGKCDRMPARVTVHEFPRHEKLETYIHKATIMTETVFIVTFRIDEIFELETVEIVTELDVGNCRTAENHVTENQVGEDQAVDEDQAIDEDQVVEDVPNVESTRPVENEIPEDEVPKTRPRTFWPVTSLGRNYGMPLPSANAEYMYLWRQDLRTFERKAPVSIWMRFPEKLRVIRWHPSNVVEVPYNSRYWAFEKFQGATGGAVVRLHYGSEVLIAFVGTKNRTVEITAYEITTYQSDYATNLAHVCNSLTDVVQSGSADSEGYFSLFSGYITGRLQQSTSVPLTSENETLKAKVVDVGIPGKIGYVIDIELEMNAWKPESPAVVVGTSRPSSEPATRANVQSLPMLAYASGDRNWNAAGRRDSTFTRTNVLND